MAQPARLTSALLARKGDALPTGGFAHTRLDLVPPQPSAARLEQQRCGTSVPRAPLLPDITRPAAQKPSRRADRAGQDRVAFTVRLDRQRHTRLKILAARRGRSGQEILIKALDAYLEACATDCACLRSAAKHGDS